ncbi:SDR family oxidoreductase [Amylibacter sp.]|nr:SDR family oxidoreductase [Amylibacter sp.]
MKILIIGGTGLLGSMLKRFFDSKGIYCATIARKNATFDLDLINQYSLSKIIKTVKPSHVINSFAITNLRLCEENEHLAEKAHVDIVRSLSDLSNEIGFKFIHISTDQVYDNIYKHGSKETDPLCAKNIYVKTKIEGERYVSASGLILRTAFLGRRLNGSLSLSDYYFSVIQKNQSARIFNDVYSSALDTVSLCEVIFHLIQSDLSGIYNIGTHQPYLKSELFDLLCAKLNVKPHNIEYASCNLLPRRNKNCGLNCDKIINTIQIKLPKLDQVCDSLIREWENEKCM